MVGVQGILSGPGVTPNADKDSEWRQQAGYGYSGIAVSTGGLSPWWMLPLPLADIVRRAPARIESSVIPPDPLVLALRLRADGFAFRPRRLTISPRGRLRVSTAAWALPGQLLMLATGRVLSPARQMARGNLTHVISGGLRQRARLAANGEAFWPHEAYELLMLGFPAEVVLQTMFERDASRR